MAAARILLVEDESALAALICKYLERLGYSVDACESGVAAWERFSAGPENYDLVIVDLTLPDLPGETLLRRILDRSPGIPALICSGAPDPGLVADGERVRFLQKPFLPAMLAERVKSALGR